MHIFYTVMVLIYLYIYIFLLFSYLDIINLNIGIFKEFEIWTPVLLVFGVFH